MKPTYADVPKLAPGIYDAAHLSPPSGDDCTHLLVRENGTIGWCDANGTLSTTEEGQGSSVSKSERMLGGTETTGDQNGNKEDRTY